MVGLPDIGQPLGRVETLVVLSLARGAVPETASGYDARPAVRSQFASGRLAVAPEMPKR
jgi:hypothetical protein